MKDIQLFGDLGLTAYQNAARSTIDYPDQGRNLIYPALGLAGETGEAVDKIKKLWRNQGITGGSSLEPEAKRALLHELGDVLWYLAALAGELGTALDVIARMNLDKLADRLARNVIKSEGDTR
jgi:NTP pyrophosphatase (non-canonical NTP hydrolase)